MEREPAVRPVPFLYITKYYQKSKRKFSILPRKIINSISKNSQFYLEKFSKVQEYIT